MLLDQFLDYVKFETTSYSDSESFPSNKKELKLQNYLLQELKSLGLKDCRVDDHGYLYAYIEGDPSKPTIGLIAHVDTSEAASGKNVKPRVIENYDGNDIVLNEKVTTKVSKFRFLKNYKGKTLVVTDGNTLLGADDKAGVAIIMNVAKFFIANPEIKHNPIRICFTPDEEIGRGTDFFDYENFKVDFAYTLDGNLPNCIEYENFNADTLYVDVHGVAVHPGSAKGKLVNAIKVAYEFNKLLDPKCVPEKTEGYEGYNHLGGIKGDASNVTMEYFIRNHSLKKLHLQEADFYVALKKINEKYGYNAIEIEVVEGYRNMKDKFIGHTYPIDLVKKAMKELNIPYKAMAIRGGTDGANLTQNGILCPNLGTGGENFHGVHEFWCVEYGEQMVDLVKKILTISHK